MKFTEEHRRKLSESKIGSKNPFYGKKHSPEIIERFKKIRGENHHFWKGGSKEATKRYRLNNLDKIKHLKSIREAREKNAIGSYTLGQWEDLKIKYEYKCAICKEAKKLQRDHIIPISKGGTNFIDNIQPLCVNCNSKKSAKINTDNIINGIAKFENNGILQSVLPITTSFGYSYFSNLICPFEPKSVLMVGYGEGTVAGLIKKVYEWRPIIIGLDKNISISGIGYADEIIIGDAKEEIKNLKNKFDYVIVDIANGDLIPNWVFNEEFVKDLAKITKKLLSINILNNQGNLDNYYNYFNFDLMKEFLSNKIYFFKSKKVKESEWFL